MVEFVCIFGLALGNKCLWHFVDNYLDVFIVVELVSFPASVDSALVPFLLRFVSGSLPSFFFISSVAFLHQQHRRQCKLSRPNFVAPLSGLLLMLRCIVTSF